MQKFSSRLVGNRHKLAAKMKLADMYEDAMQKVLTEIHAIWQDKDITMSELFSELPDFKKFLFSMAKLNYQVQNGGFAQWMDNGYAEDTAEFLEDQLGILTDDKNNAHMTQLRKVKRLLTRVQDALLDNDLDWSSSRDAGRDSNDDSLEKFESWFENTDHKYRMTSFNRDLLATARNLGIKGSRISTESVWYSLGNGSSPDESMFDDDVTFQFEGKALVYRELLQLSEQKMAQAEEATGEEEPNGEMEESEMWGSLNRELTDFLGWLSEVNSDYKGNLEGGDMAAELDRCDSMYYESIQTDLLWKEVAHAAELMADGDDFEEPAMEEEASLEASDETVKESSIAITGEGIDHWISEVDEQIDSLDEDEAQGDLSDVIEQLISNANVPEEFRQQVRRHFVGIL